MEHSPIVDGENQIFKMNQEIMFYYYVFFNIEMGRNYVIEWSPVAMSPIRSTDIRTFVSHENQSTKLLPIHDYGRCTKKDRRLVLKSGEANSH